MGYIYDIEIYDIEKILSIKDFFIDDLKECFKDKEFCTERVCTGYIDGGCQEYNIYQDYMKHWNNIHNDIFNLDYEELIENPDKIMKNLFEYIDEEFNTDYNKFYKKTVSCNTSSSYQIKQPLNKKGIGKSNNYKNFMPNLNEK